MCVILVCYDKEPTKGLLELCAEKNPHGAGIAWREGEGDKAVIRWEKGLGLRVKDITKRIGQIKLPYIIHFRIASVGAVVGELNHPFPFGGQSRALAGESKYGVLFHNGTFHMWKSELRDLCRYTGRRLPDGDLSDTRALAILTGVYGPSWLQTIDERVAYLTPTECKILGTAQQGWCRRAADGSVCSDKEPGIWLSNDNWERSKQNPTSATTSGTERGGVVSGYGRVGNSAYGRSHSSLATPPNPWVKPADCKHEGSSHWIEGKRFCTPCGIRLNTQGSEPWIVPATPTSDAIATNVKGVDHTASIAARVHRLVGMNISRVNATTTTDGPLTH